MPASELLQSDAQQPASKLQDVVRVLHLVNGEYFAGAERVQDLLAMNLPPYGYEVGFVCVKPDRFPRFRQSLEAPLWEVPVRHPADKRGMRRIAAIARDEGFGLVHSHTPRTAWAAGFCLRSELPLVHTIHDMSFELQTGWLRRGLNGHTRTKLGAADAVIAVSPQVLKMAERLRVGRRRYLVRNGVAAAGPIEQRSVPDCWTLGTVALMRPGKGLEVLVRALALLKSARQPVRLLLVGRFESSEYEAEILGLVSELGLADTVEFTGFTDDVPAQLRQMDLFVMPSTIPEGLPMVLLEALAHGLPIVGSQVAGITDVVRDGVDGLLTQAGDEQALAADVQRIISTPDEWFAMRAACHQRHEEEFSVDRMARETARVYDTVLTSCPVSPSAGEA